MIHRPITNAQTSVISVQKYIFILACIQFSINHFSFYLVLVLSSLIHFVLIQF